MRITTAAAGIVLGAALVAGCSGGGEGGAPTSGAVATATERTSETTSATAAPGTAMADRMGLALGTPARVEGSTKAGRFRMTVVVSPKVRTSKTTVADYSQRATGTWVGFRVQYRCELGVCPFSAYDVDVHSATDGRTAVEHWSGFAPRIGGGRLLPGRQVWGYVTFDLPKGGYDVDLVPQAEDGVPVNWTYRQA